jgi:hypothetical protein
MKCVSIFSTTFVWNIFHSKKNWARKRVLVFMYSTRYSSLTSINLEFSRQIFEKYSNVKSYENPLSGSPLFHADRRTDRHDKANSHFFAILLSSSRIRIEMQRSSILILLLLESCLQTCTTYTIAECTVKNSGWYWYWYILVNCNWVDTRWQYTFTHKQYKEHHN